MAEKGQDTGKTVGAAGREARLKAALKANIAKRKAQARARQAETGPKATGDKA